MYVIYGSPSLKKVIDLAGGEQDAVFYGAGVNDTLGFNLAVAPVGTGGENVLAMTARLASGPGDAYPQAGEVHLVRGKAIAATTDLADDPASDLGRRPAGGQVDDGRDDPFVQRNDGERGRAADWRHGGDSVGGAVRRWAGARTRGIGRRGAARRGSGARAGRPRGVADT